MNLSTFIYLVLIYSIPYFWYIRFSTSPKKGFSILFISLISTVLLINFNLLVFAGIIILLTTLLHQNQKLSNVTFFVSFIILIYEAYSTLDGNLISTFLPITLVSGIFSLMMIGHWFLVDPTITRIGMKNIARSSMLIAGLLSLMIITGLISSEISTLYKNIIIGLYISSLVLSLGSLKSLNETSYTGVMAATGLSYLSLLVSLGGTGTLILLP
ncbi:hypothetical protein OAJ22_00045 [Acidimicrobiaceae bacterium]|nr:hypothetical protein [Acidimicrobiaceae bacterium]